MMIQRGQGWYGGGQRRCLSAGEGFLKEWLARHDGMGVGRYVRSRSRE